MVEDSPDKEVHREKLRTTVVALDLDDGADRETSPPRPDAIQHNPPIRKGKEDADADDHGAQSLLAVRAAHRLRRARDADRLGGPGRVRQGRLLAGEVLPPERAMLQADYRSREGLPERRIDGCSRGAASRGPPDAASQVSTIRLGTLPGSREQKRPLPGAWCVSVPGVHQRRKERRRQNEPRRVHRQVQGGHRPAGGGVLPAALPALGERRGAPAPAPQAPGGAGRRHQGRRPLAGGPPGHDGRGRDGHRQDIHRQRPPLTWRASRGCWCSARPTWCPNGSGRWR